MWRSITTFPGPPCITSRCEPTPIVPSPLVRSTMTAVNWLFWRSTEEVDNAQRYELGLPKATHRAQRRMSDRGSLEIQVYDEVCFPGLAAVWATRDARRPFVGALSMELTRDADDGRRVVDRCGSTA